MNIHQIHREVSTLSSGTLSVLFGVRNYDDIDAFAIAWLSWLARQGEDRRWECWQDCWNEYRETAEYARFRSDYRSGAA